MSEFPSEPNLFSPLTLRQVTIRNRIGVSPMCMYSAQVGIPNAWHMVHLGSRAVGGAGVVVAEATSVSPEGRISPADTGIWNDEQAEAWSGIAAFISEQGAVPVMQLAHAGRKAGTSAPWKGGGPLTDLDWDLIGPSPVAFGDGFRVPREMDLEDIQRIIAMFADAAKRSLQAGFKAVEVHAAHGYLLHQFCSPRSNLRTDAFGGSFEKRTRLIREVIVAVRRVWPKELPIFLRVSATDWVDDGWTIEDSVAISAIARELGVDLIDVSSGGNIAAAQIPVGPGYQVPFAERVRKEAGIPTAAVGLITDPLQAAEIIGMGKADMVLLARESLRDPYWPRRAASILGSKIEAPKQYQRGW
ncbi:MAG: NADH:flavin oxidoreductase/NADH oxidase [Fimbriimonadaceae bacterium]|nr:NADH:flavin oxidoreductase/NADH oxidase [Fimbriimonadaceae bacterium]